MKKQSVLTRFLAVMILAASLFGMLAVTASAETLTADLTYLDRQMNLAIQVVYTDNGTGEVPQISFIGPNGQEYIVGVSSETEISAEYYDGAILYLIPNARAGQWQIRYDSAFSGHLQVTCSPYSRQIDIEAFTIASLDNNYANVEFSVAFDENSRYNYIISAVTTDENGNVESRKELSTGTAYANNGVTSVRVPIYDLATYDDYKLHLEVYLDDNGIETSDSMLTDPFAYVDPDAPDALGDFYITLDRTAGMLYMDWTNVDTWRADEYIVAVFTSLNSEEPVYYDTLDGGITTATALVDPAVSSITVELYWRDGSALSQVKSVTFNPTQVVMQIVSEETTASAQAQLNYMIPDGMQAQVLLQVNDREPVQTQLSGSGTMGITLDEGENVVHVYHWLTDYISILDTKEIFSDRRAPILSFFEDVDGITTSESSFHLMGMTEAGASVTVNGNAATINADGTFELVLGHMVAGENVFEIVSADAVGNQIRRTVIIFCAPSVEQTIQSAPGWMQYLPLAISCVVALLIAVLVLFLFTDKGREMTAALVLKRCAIAGWSVSVVSGGVTLWALIEKLVTSDVVNSTKFFDYVQESFQQAYEILQDYHRYTELLGILLIVTAALVTISLILTILALLLGRRKGTDQPPKAPKKPKDPKPPKEPKPKKKKGKKEKPAKPVAAAAQSVPAAPVQPAPVAPQPEPAVQPVPEPAVQPAQQPPVTHAFCTNCGTKRSADATFCTECGAKFE